MMESIKVCQRVGRDGILHLDIPVEMILPFGDEAALIGGQVRARLASSETPIGSYDLLIAAIATHQESALANDLTLVTHNTREFERVNGLQIEDWEVEV
jgi:tRNA(fMet)-specific endonuclease VapC